jgi:eukaryotic-like serine/threonine-protein kinase
MPVLTAIQERDVATYPDSSRRIGRVIHDWRIDRKLGTGSTAHIYAATHVGNGRRAALKILRDGQIDETTRRRFAREGFAANAVGHPGVVNIFDQGVTDDGLLFIVMELLDGSALESLREAAGGTLPVKRVIDIACELLDILSAAHARGVIHRDLKPANVFVTADGKIKVLDFGIAHLAESMQPSATGPRGDITHTGVVIGTPAFMPPEQALGRRSEVDARSDLWSLGATLYLLLSGRPVHVAASLPAQMLAAMTKPAAPLRSVAPSVPQAVAAVIDRALAVDRNDRWEDAESMCRALRWARMPLGVSQPMQPIPTPTEFVTTPVVKAAQALLEEVTPVSSVVPRLHAEDDESPYDAATRVGPMAALPPQATPSVSPIAIVAASPAESVPVVAPPPLLQAQQAAPPSWRSLAVSGAVAFAVSGAVALALMVSADRLRHKSTSAVLASAAPTITLEELPPIVVEPPAAEPVEETVGTAAEAAAETAAPSPPKARPAPKRAPPLAAPAVTNEPAPLPSDDGVHPSEP